MKGVLRLNGLRKRNRQTCGSLLVARPKACLYCTAQVRWRPSLKHCRMQFWTRGYGVLTESAFTHLEYFLLSECSKVLAYFGTLEFASLTLSPSELHLLYAKHCILTHRNYTMNMFILSETAFIEFLLLIIDYSRIFIPAREFRAVMEKSVLRIS